MKINFYILLNFSCFALFAQNGIKVEYGLSFGLLEKEKGIEQYIKRADAASKQMTFVLEANDNEAVFFLVPGLVTNERDGKLAIGLSNYENLIYIKLADKFYLYNNTESTEFKTKEFLVKDTIFDKWSIKNETKIIQGLKCYKATGIKIVRERDTNVTFAITAWFCPEISYKFGPMGYGNLPGLILELHENNMVYGAKNILFGYKNTNIKPLSEGALISSTNYFATKTDRVLNLRR